MDQIVRRALFSLLTTIATGSLSSLVTTKASKVSFPLRRRFMLVLADPKGLHVQALFSLSRFSTKLHKRWWVYKGERRLNFISLFTPDTILQLAYSFSGSLFLRGLALGLVFSGLALYLALVYFVVPFGSWVFTGLTLIGVSYTLLSGFVYFTTRTGFGRNTDIGQRFWKRSFSLFWLLEFGLFGTVVYFTLTAPSEVGYGYDTPAVFKAHFFSLPDFFFRAVMFSAMLFCLSCLLGLNARSRVALVGPLHGIIAFLFCGLLYIEVGVFQAYLNYAGFYKWLINVETYEHILESELARSRVIHGFVLFASIVKFWHFLLIAVVWFFYLARYFEYEDTRPALLTSVFQSFLILYGLNFLMLAPYLKYLGRKYMSNPYYWFFETPDFNSLGHAIDFTRLFYFG